MKVVMLIPMLVWLLMAAGVPASAGLIDPSVYLTKPSFGNPYDATSYVANPSFEIPSLVLYTTGGLDRCNYQQALPEDWSGSFTRTSGTTNSLRHYRPGTPGLKSNGGYFWDPTDGVNGAAVILRSNIPQGWMYQSLGTVSEEDIGWIFIAEIDSSNRAGMGEPFDGERRVSFRTGVTLGDEDGEGSGLYVGGDFGELMSMGLPRSARSSGPDDPWHTLSDWFQPTEEHLGQEIFLVFSVEMVTTAGNSAGQYQFDNLRLWVVPEPTSTLLAVMGLLGLLCCIGRRRRAHDVRQGG